MVGISQQTERGNKIDDEETVSIAAAARLAGCSVSTMYDAINNGAVPHVTIGRPPKRPVKRVRLEVINALVRGEWPPADDA